MKIFSLFSVCFLYSVTMTYGMSHGQTVHPVDSSPDALFKSVLEADNGDILELTEPGEYRIKSLIQIDKKLTIRAAKSLKTRPVLRNFHATAETRFIFEIVTGGHLTVEGLEMDGMAGSDFPAEYLIKTAAQITGSYSLIVDNCYLHDVKIGERGSFFRGYGETFADTVKFTNSVFYNCGKIGIRINDSDNDVKHFEFSNSSMINVRNEGIYVQGSDVVFRVNHCTFDNVGYGTADIIRPRFVLDAEIKNSIFSNVSQPRSRAMLLYGNSVIDYCAFYKVGGIKIHDPQATTLGEHVLFDVDPQYTGAIRNEFSLLDSSPLQTYAEDGGPLGDPNWSNKRNCIPAAHSEDIPKLTEDRAILDRPSKEVKAPASPGEVIPVGLTLNALHDTLVIAKDGDILELTEVGEYLLNNSMRIDKSITIRAAEGLATKPVIKNINPTTETRFIFEIVTGGNLTLSGLDLDGMADSKTPAKYLLKTASSVSGTYKLLVEDCILHDVVDGDYGNFFRAYRDTHAESVIFRSCVLYNCGSEGIRIKDADNTVSYFEISKSTMYDTKGEGIYVQGNEVVFRINHCTFNHLGSEHKEMVRPRYVVDIDIRNTIFSNTPKPHSRTMLFYGSSSSLDHCDFFNVGAVETHDPAFKMGANVLVDVDPQFEDAENGKFTLLETSPLYQTAADGAALGDPRWAVKKQPSPGAVIPVGLTQNALHDALVIAADGDILELTEVGEHLLNNSMRIDKSITIRAAEGLATKPVIKNVNPTAKTRFIFEIVSGGNLTLSGLDLDGMADSKTPAKYLLKTASSISGTYKLLVEDCILHDVVNGEDCCFFRASGDTHADSVIFKNCVLYNCGGEGIRIRDASNTVSYFEISESTMYDTKGEGIYVQGNEVVFRINHCTFDNLGYGHKDMVRPRFVMDADIRNTIFSNTPKPYSRTMLIYGSSSMDHCDFFNVGSVKIHDTAAFNMGANVLIDVDPHYKDAANGNYTLLETSPLYYRSKDRAALGDPRWAVNAPPFVNVVIPVGLAQNALYDSLMIAKDGDILELTEVGEYQLDSTMRIGKSITIRAAEGLATKPVIKNVNPLTDSRFIFEIVSGGRLTLSGLDLDGIRFEHAGKVSIENGK